MRCFRPYHWKRFQARLASCTGVLPIYVSKDLTLHMKLHVHTRVCMWRIRASALQRCVLWPASSMLLSLMNSWKQSPCSRCNGNQPSTLPSFKGLPIRRYSFTCSYSCDMIFSSCWNKAYFAIPVQTLLAVWTSCRPWWALAEAGLPHQTQLLQFQVQAPTLSLTCIALHFNIKDWQKINLAVRSALGAFSGCRTIG